MGENFRSLKMKSQGKYLDGGIREVINADYYITYSFVTPITAQ
jgi:hypothetical protein